MCCLVFQVIKDVVAIHRVGQWTDERNPILDLKLQADNLARSRDANMPRSQDVNMPRLQDANTPRSHDAHLATNRNCCCHLSGASGLDGGRDLLPSESSDAVSRMECSQDAHKQCRQKVPEESEGTDMCDSEAVLGSGEAAELTPDTDIQKKQSNESLSWTVAAEDIADSSACTGAGLSQRSSSSGRPVSDTPTHLVKDTPDDSGTSEPSAKRLKTQTNGTHGSCAVGSPSTISTSTVAEPVLEPENLQRNMSLEERVRASEDRLQEVTHPGFDINKWVPDPHCAECTKTYLDPDPHKLMIYLHALRYTVSYIQHLVLLSRDTHLCIC